jgi:hypothetical protein
MAIVLSMAFMLFNLLFNQAAQAVPSFARQTGQSCVACHAGGQYPELTSYGRLFKLTGYTIGERGNPLAVMATASQTRTQNPNDTNGTTTSNTEGAPIIEGGSLFIAGKVTDNIGGFVQLTYAAYDSQAANGMYNSFASSDNMDFRYADRKVDSQRDLIWGVTVHNNPTVQDVWNSSPAWGYPWIGPGGLANKTQIEGGLAQQVAGIGAYVYLNKSIYAELTSYQTAKGAFKFMSLGYNPGDMNGHTLTHLDGNALYWRLAYTKEWDAHNFMVGAFGMDSKVLPNDDAGYPIFGAGSTKYQDVGFDAQYQYLLAPHTVTAHFRMVQEKIDDPNGHVYTDGPATLNTNMAKVSYVYRAKYGASLAYANSTGSADTTLYSSSALYKPDTEVWTPEFFWIPLQNLRVGVQFNYFTKYYGAAKNYDGNGRDASDNNTTYIYAWTSF